MPTPTSHPRRVQARRAENYKAVHRPTRWGNPFAITAACPRAESMRRYALWLERRLAEEPDFLEPLRGYDLGCFCAPEEQCHADVLLAKLYGGRGKAKARARTRP